MCPLIARAPQEALTALHFASRSGHLEVARALLEAKADVEGADQVHIYIYIYIYRIGQGAAQVQGRRE